MVIKKFESPMFSGHGRKQICCILCKILSFVLPPLMDLFPSHYSKKPGLFLLGVKRAFEKMKRLFFLGADWIFSIRAFHVNPIPFNMRYISIIPSFRLKSSLPTVLIGGIGF